MLTWKAIQKNVRLDEPEICVENIFIFIVLKKIHFLSLYRYINGCGVDCHGASCEC